MATKNFLFLVCVLSFALSSCRTSGVRDAKAPKQLPSPSTQATPPPPVAVSTGETPILKKEEASKIYPVGIYLGPGALRTYAHIGVLRVLQKAQVPIVAIGGLEWGSIIAAQYALSKSANDLEWQMMKLSQDKLPQKAILNRSIEVKESSELSEFLKNTFNDKNLSGAQPAFSCPTNDGDDSIMLSSGNAKDTVLRCAVMPPLYQPHFSRGRLWTSGAVAPGDWPAVLKSAGAQYIIYVDVLSRGQFWDSQKMNDSTSRVLWAALKGISRQQHKFAHLTIEVPLDMDILQFDARREAISVGERYAQKRIDDILKSIGLAR